MMPRVDANGEDTGEGSEQEVQGEVGYVNEGKTLEEEGVYEGVEDEGRNGEEDQGVYRVGKNVVDHVDTGGSEGEGKEGNDDEEEGVNI